MSTHSPVLCCVRTDALVVVSAKTVPGFGGLVSLITLGGAVHPRHNSRCLHILCYFNLSHVGMWELSIKLSNRHCMWGWGCPMIRVHICHGGHLALAVLSPRGLLWHFCHLVSMRSYIHATGRDSWYALVCGCHDSWLSYEWALVKVPTFHILDTPGTDAYGCFWTELDNWSCHIMNSV